MEMRTATNHAVSHTCMPSTGPRTCVQSMILTISQQYAKPLTAQCKAKHCGCVHLIAQCTVPSSPETHSAVPLALVGVLDIHVVARAMFGAEAENNRSVGHKAGFKMRRKRTTYHGWKEETERARQERNKLGNTPRTPNETQPKHLPFQPAGGMREREFDFAAPRWIANGQARNQCEVTDTPPGAEKHTSALPTCALSSRGACWCWNSGLGAYSVGSCLV